MIDINELRRLAQAATPGPWINHGRQPNVAGLPHSAVAAKTLLARVYSEAYGDVEQETANASFIAAANPATISELLDRLEEAESDALEQARLLGMSGEREAALLSKLEAAEKERNALRAKIEATRKAIEARTTGAQPAPIIPEGWKPIPEKHPTFDLVDLKLADGSVLCGCVPQGDGDYWWEGPSGEVFIDPKYAPATHWRLATAPEAKP